MPTLPSAAARSSWCTHWCATLLVRHQRVCASPHSAAQVYGDPLEHPQRETYWGNVNPIGERSCYDEGAKHAAAAPPVARRGRAALNGWRLTLPTRLSARRQARR